MAICLSLLGPSVHSKHHLQDMVFTAAGRLKHAKSCEKATNRLEIWNVYFQCVKHVSASFASPYMTMEGIQRHGTKTEAPNLGLAAMFHPARSSLDPANGVGPTCMNGSFPRKKKKSTQVLTVSQLGASIEWTSARW